MSAFGGTADVEQGMSILPALSKADAPLLFAKPGQINPTPRCGFEWSARISLAYALSS